MHHRTNLLPLAALVTALAAAGAARADDILLQNGNRLEGKARREGDQVVVETSQGGQMRLPAADVKTITVAPTRLELYQERLAKLPGKDAAAQLALADWCNEKKLFELEKKHLRAILALDADHAAARARLGFVRYEERWLTEDEYHAARGFVKVGAEWMSKDEVAQRKTAAVVQQSQRDHSRRVSGCVAKMSSPRRAVRLEGRLALMQYAEQIHDTHLAQFASEVASYYNDAWRAVKAEYTATARVDVRATMTTLKRPIPTITTSLGASSTPVTIQLPELQVVSIRTTALVPITIELDEE